MKSVLVPTPTHGRVLVAEPAVRPVRGALVGCHGYGQNAEHMLDELRRLPGAAAWHLVSVQALHRFYTRNDQAVVASWMTRQDRDAAIADNIEYLNRAVHTAVGDLGPLVFLGFSQGASMAARAAARSPCHAAGLILLGGDIPSDVKDDPGVTLPPVLVGVGSTDTWYQARVDADVAFLERRGVPHTVIRFTGGHEFTDEWRAAAGAWLSRIAGGT
jgi:predicted esterase